MTQIHDFGKSIAFALWPFLAIFKMLSFFKYLLFFGAVFCIEEQQCVVETFLACFYAFLIFDPKWEFWQVYSLCFVAILSNFQNGLIFRILAFSWSRFLHRTTAMCCRNVLIFDPKWRFWQVYSFWLVAILGNFQNALIFRILAVFWSSFFHRTTVMCCRNVFSMFLCIFNFWPKVRILPSL